MLKPLKTSIRILVILLLAILFTLLCVNESKKIGRLASSPNYDDVVYFHDGAILVHSLKSEGLSGFWSFLNQRGLHSPYSVFLAAASFALFGFDYSSPYLASGIVAFTYLLCIGWFLRKLPLLTWIAALILFLTLPFITMGIVEFRPDIAWAVVTGFGVVFIVTENVIFRNSRHAAIAALFFALSLTIKPSTFVMTLLLYTGATTSRIIADVWANRNQSQPRRTFAGVAVFIAVLLIVAGPYWLRFGKDAVSYFMENSFGINKAVWVYQGSLSEFLLFYVTGDGARSNIAISGSVLSLLSFGCMVFLALKKLELRWKLFVLISLILGALFVNTVAQMKSPFLGGGIYGVWLFTCAYLIATTYACFTLNELKWFNRGRDIIIIVTALICICFYRWPAYSNWGTDMKRCENYRNANEFIIEALEKNRLSPPKSIIFIQAGPVVMESAGIWFPKNGLKSVVSSGAFIRSEVEFRKTYPTQQWIVIQEEGVMGGSPNMPSEKMLPKFLEILKSDKSYVPIKEYAALDGKRVWIYARK